MLTPESKKLIQTLRGKKNIIFILVAVVFFSFLNSVAVTATLVMNYPSIAKKTVFNRFSRTRSCFHKVLYSTRGKAKQKVKALDWEKILIK